MSKIFILLLFITSFASADVTDDLRRIPIQDQGRIKPLGTFADFSLLQLNGKRSFESSSGEKFNSVQWLKVVLFFPSKADGFRHFVTDNTRSLLLVGYPQERIEKRRMRFSYNELALIKEALFEKAKVLIKKDAKNRSVDEQALLQIALNVKTYERLRSVLNFASYGSEIPPEVKGALNGGGLSEMLEKLPEVRAHLNGISSNPEFNVDRVRSFFEKLQKLASSNFESRFYVIPPSEDGQSEWLSLDDIVVNKLVDFDDKLQYESQLKLLFLWEEVWNARDSPDFEKAVAELADASVETAKIRGEYDKIPLEISYYKFDLVTKSLFLFMLGFIIICFSWMKGSAKTGLLLCRSSFAVTCLGAALLITAIIMRCLIRSRPPVSTLYETVLFITAVTVLVSGFIAVIRKSSIMVGVMTIAGAAGMFLSIKYEMKEAVDTMPRLQAVLDTNFWLSTHVTSITVGYAAGILAGIISHIYLLLKFLDLKGWKKMDIDLENELSRYVYGAVCFGLIFSFIGTLLGGIWANYSWGRFWGWDPKENGAMLIVLWFIITLHARKAGYIKKIGLHVMSVLSVIVISFSWWGVNLLGVGLHSYGFTSGVSRLLLVVYIFESIVALAGFCISLANKNRSTVNKPV